MITGVSAGDARSRNFSTAQPMHSAKASTTAKERTVSPAATIRF